MKNVSSFIHPHVVPKLCGIDNYQDTLLKIKFQGGFYSPKRFCPLNPLDVKYFTSK